MNKKQIAVNTHLIFLGVFFLIILGIFEAVVRAEEIGLSIGFGFFLLLPILLFSISPQYFVFTDEYLEIVYLFGQKEIIKWHEIRSISQMGSWISRGGFPHYEIIYPSKEKRPFFVVGEVSKTVRTRRLLKQYYKREIL
jgi:hypothetical protein